MGIEPHDACVHQSRPAPVPAVLHGFAHDAIRSQKISAIHFLAKELRKAGYQFANVATGGLALEWNGNRVAVVFDEKQKRQALDAGDIQRFPEFTFASR